MRNSRGTRKLSIAGTFTVLLLSASSAGAAPTVVELAPGIGGPRGARRGPGNEQQVSVQMQKGGALNIVTFYMSSNVRVPDPNSDDGRWQCKCSSVVVPANG